VTGAWVESFRQSPHDTKSRNRAVLRGLDGEMDAAPRNFQRERRQLSKSRQIGDRLATTL
jgi:hypothetical protein